MNKKCKECGEALYYRGFPDTFSSLCDICEIKKQDEIAIWCFVLIPVVFNLCLIILLGQDFFI